MRSASRRAHNPRRDGRLWLLVLVSGFALVASAAIQLTASGALTLHRLTSGRVRPLTLVQLGGGLVVTLLLVAMVRALVASNVRLAASENDARELLALQARRFAALEREGWDGVMIVDRMASIRWMGVTAARILRLDPNDVAGASLLGFIDVRNLDDFLAALAIDKNEARASFEFQMRDADGTLRWYEAVTSNHVDDEAVSGVVLHFRDVTEKHAVEQAPRDRDSHVRSALERSPFGAAIVNAEGVLVSVNRALAGYAGRKVAPLIGRRVGTLLSPRGRAAVRSAMRKLRDGEIADVCREVTLSNDRLVQLALTPILSGKNSAGSFLMQVVALPESAVQHEQPRAVPLAEPIDQAVVEEAMVEEAVVEREATPEPELALEPLETGSFALLGAPSPVDGIPDDTARAEEVASEPDDASRDSEEPRTVVPLESRDLVSGYVLRAIIGARRAEGNGPSEPPPAEQSETAHDVGLPL